jgi:hypothetical protein
MYFSTGRLAVLILAISFSQTPEAVTNVATQPLLPKAHIQLEASGAMIKVPRRSKDAHSPAMRREGSEGVVEELSGEKPLRIPALAGKLPAALQEQRVTHNHANDHRKQAPEAVAPAESTSQAFSRWLYSCLPRVPASQQPALAAAFFLLFGACGFLVYYLLQATKKPTKADEEALRQRVMRMRERMGAAPEGKSRLDVLCLGEKGNKGLAKGKGKAMEKGAGKEGSATEKGAKGVEKGAKGVDKGAGKGTPLEAFGALSRFFCQGSEPTRPIPVGAAGLGLGQRSKGPGSVSSIASSQHSGLSSSLSHALEASSAASTRTSNTQKALTGKSNGHKDGASPVQELLAMLKAVGLIQTAWRRWKANQKLPASEECITLVCDILEGSDMPNVNRFGGCDPYVECRIVHGDPTNRLRGDLDISPLHSVQTEVKRNDMAPSWDQRLILADVKYSKDLYMQLVLWDYDLARSQPIGHVAVPLSHALSRHGLRRAVRTMEIAPLPGVEVSGLKAKARSRLRFFAATGLV